MPFGLTNAPTTFQATMNELFRQYLRKFVLVFFDAILVYSNSWEERLKQLRVVTELLQQHCFVAYVKKCSFGKYSVEYLGHILSAGGVSMDPNKVANVLSWPTPRSIKGVRGFLGLTGYYRKFIKNYGKNGLSFD